MGQLDRDHPNRILEDVTTTAAGGVLLLSPDHRILWCNNAALKEADRPLKDVLGRHCYEVTHHFDSPCEPPLHPCPIAEDRQISEPVSSTHTHSGRGGKELAVKIHVGAIKDSRGKLARIVHVSTSVTNPERVDEALEGTRGALEESVARQIERQKAYGLTVRELTILVVLAASGPSDRDIAEILRISPLTVSTHVTRILHKMRATSRTEAAVRAVREGLVY